MANRYVHHEIHLRDKLLEYLGQHRGEWIPRDVLIDMLYADREDGGPNCAVGVFYQVIHELRAADIPIEHCDAYRIPPRRTRG